MTPEQPNNAICENFDLTLAKVSGPKQNKKQIRTLGKLLLISFLFGDVHMEEQSFIMLGRL